MRKCFECDDLRENAFFGACRPCGSTAEDVGPAEDHQMFDQRQDDHISHPRFQSYLGSEGQEHRHL